MALLCSIMYGVLYVLLGLLALMAVDFYRLPKSPFFELRDLVASYAMRRLVLVLAWFKWRAFQRNVRDFVGTQERFLLKQIRDNELTGYGRDHQFQRIHSLADFRRLHPVTDYHHYADYIARAEKGDTQAMLGRDKIEMFACSSGTTGKAKHIPVSSGFTKSFVDLIGAIYGFYSERLNSSMPLYKELQVMCQPRWRFAESGVPIGPLSGLFMKKRIMMMQWATPFEANVVDTEHEALYVSLLFALRDRRLAFIEGGFAAGFFNMLNFMEHHWRDLVADIETGRLKESLNVSDDKRAIINRFLVADPARARELETEFTKGMEGIVHRVFPEMTGVNVLSSGTSMALYKQRCLPYMRGLQMRSTVYGSSEAFMGVNMRPSGSQEPAYVMIPSMALVEFLPVDETGSALEGAQPLLATEVELGKLYEPVVTNCSGFYRYRMGDVVKVVDFYHQAPAVDFQFRAGQLLNVHMEKLSEESFYRALQATVAQWPGVTLRDFTTAESVLDPAPRPGAPYYLVFLELESGAVTSDQLAMLDAELCKQNYVYQSFRVKDSIAPMRVRLVGEGAFAAFRQFTFDTTTAYLGQYKQPRVLRTGAQVQCLLQRVLPR